MRRVAIFGCPRSGTSWLGQLYNSHEAVLYRYQPLFAYEFKNWFGVHGLSEHTLARFHSELVTAQSDFVLTELRPLKQAGVSHLVWKEVRFHRLMPPLMELQGGLDRLVYLYRRPEDVLNSWYQAPKEFRAGQDIYAEYLYAPSKNTDPSEFNGFAKWKESLQIALALQSRHPGRVKLVPYERLRAEPVIVLQRLFDDIGLSLSPQVREFIAQSTSRQDEGAYSVFRNERTPMRLPAAIADEVSNDPESLALLARADALAV
jgi:Sulfotransferase domain